MSAMSMRRALPLACALSLAACGASPERAARPEAEAGHAGESHVGQRHGDEGIVTLTADQIAAAGIAIGRPMIGGAGTIDLPALIEGDPQRVQIVSAAIGGRVVSLTRNLGDAVARGQTLAIIESREAAQLGGEVAATRARLALAETNLARERRLVAEQVSPRQDLDTARAAAAEARALHAQARAQLAAAGGGAGGLNRIAVTATLGGRVIARSAMLGQTVVADTELFRVADLGRVAVSLSLQPAQAGRVAVGNAVIVTAAGRRGQARVSFVSPVLDGETRLVPTIAMLDNRDGRWRVGEPVTAAVQLSGSGGDGAVRVPATAVQTVENRPTVFVRTPTGFRAVAVSLGDAAGEDVIVRSGLTGRERIATTGSFILKAELGKGEAAHADH